MADIHAARRAAQAAAEETNLASIAAEADEIVVENGGFEAVLPFLKMGRRAQRAGWNGKGMYIWVEVPLAEDELPYLCMRAADGKRVTGWLASQTDILSHDWRTLRDGEIGKAGE